MPPSDYYRQKVRHLRDFDYTLDYSQLDLREQPALYRIGRGEQGVLLVQPYKSEILPHWRFKNPDIAELSAQKIYAMFQEYLALGDFVGADMARKFLQMGYTRSRRYANHTSGKKYIENPQTAANMEEEKAKRQAVLPQASDAFTNEKAQSARIFYGYYLKAKNDPAYLAQKKAFIERYG